VTTPNSGLATKIAVLEERLAGMDRALKLEAQAREDALRLQAAEYERRLKALNHAHEQAREALATYVPREMYDEFMRGTIEWRRTVDAFMTSGQTRTALFSSLVAMALTIGVVAFNYLSSP
jgi:hypothetical protein